MYLSKSITENIRYTDGQRFSAKAIGARKASEEKQPLLFILEWNDTLQIHQLGVWRPRAEELQTRVAKLRSLPTSTYMCSRLVSVAAGKKVIPFLPPRKHSQFCSLDSWPWMAFLGWNLQTIGLSGCSLLAHLTRDVLRKEFCSDPYPD